MTGVFPYTLTKIVLLVKLSSTAQVDLHFAVTLELWLRVILL
jgi:hypothetical protein